MENPFSTLTEENQIVDTLIELIDQATSRIGELDPNRTISVAFLTQEKVGFIGYGTKLDLERLILELTKFSEEREEVYG